MPRDSLPRTTATESKAHFAYAVTGVSVSARTSVKRGMRSNSRESWRNSERLGWGMAPLSLSRTDVPSIESFGKSVAIVLGGDETRQLHGAVGDQPELILVSGLFYFRRMERVFADVV